MLTPHVVESVSTLCETLDTEVTFEGSAFQVYGLNVTWNVEEAVPAMRARGVLWASKAAPCVVRVLIEIIPKKVYICLKV